jgi:signal transduction histidine kinase
MTFRRRTPDAAKLERDLAPPAERAPGGMTEPLAGIQSAFVTQATRRVASRLRTEPADPSDPELVSALLAAIALAVDQRHPDYVSRLPPGPSAELGQRLVEMIRTELLTSWTDGSSAGRPAVVLDALAALEQVRLAFGRDVGEMAGDRVGGAAALDLFLEVVHDLRSPLTSILCLADTLHRGQSGEVNSLQRRQLGLIYSSALGLSNVVNDALELARDTDELADIGPSPFSLAEVLQSVADIVEPMAHEKGLSIRLHPIEPDRRLGQPVALSRVLLNLTTNALKFTNEGGVELHCVSRGPMRVELAVQDTGPGINPLALETLYQPFRRSRGGPGYCFSGTGLGLAISRKLVRAMGSDLKLETGSAGTRFSFEVDLPVFVGH